MTPPSDIRVVELFPPPLHELLALLASLTNEDWGRPTACAGWRDGSSSGIAPRSAEERRGGHRQPRRRRGGDDQR